MDSMKCPSSQEVKRFSKDSSFFKIKMTLHIPFVILRLIYTLARSPSASLSLSHRHAHIGIMQCCFLWSQNCSSSQGMHKNAACVPSHTHANTQTGIALQWWNLVKFFFFGTNDSAEFLFRTNGSRQSQRALWNKIYEHFINFRERAHHLLSTDWVLINTSFSLRHI